MRENDPVDALIHSPAKPGIRNGAGNATRPTILAYATDLPICLSTLTRRMDT